MSRKHSNRGQMLRAERRDDRLRHRADQYARRSARAFGVVVSVAKMVELRAVIASGELTDAVRLVGTIGTSADAYAINFNGVILVAVYDRSGQSIAAFLLPTAPEILLFRDNEDVHDRAVSDASIAAVSSSLPISPAT